MATLVYDKVNSIEKMCHWKMVSMTQLWTALLHRENHIFILLDVGGPSTSIHVKEKNTRKKKKKNTQQTSYRR